MATARQIISEVQRVVGEAAGAGVQIHAEDGMLETLNRVARLAFTRFSWDQFIDWQELELDGTTGLITDDQAFVDVTGTEDFLGIYRQGEEVPLPKLARSSNPFRMTGSKVLCWTVLPFNHEDYEGKRLQFWPRTATGTLEVCTRLDPTPFNFQSETHMDRDILVAGCAWLTLLGDDLNPAAAEGFKQFMDERFGTIIKALALQPTTTTGRPPIPNDWFIRTP